MSNLYRNTDRSWDVRCGADIKDTIFEAYHLAIATKESVVFVFSDVKVTMNRDSDRGLIYRDWQRASNGYIDKNVGPYPKPELTEEEKANDARIKAEHEAQSQAFQAEYEAEEAAKRATVEAKLMNMPGIELADESAWQRIKEKNSDRFGSGIVTYAERWARLMQVEMSAGKKLEDIANNTSHEADLEGMSGATHGFAVGLLVKYWKHGEQLRRWHNRDCQLGNEGEKANEVGGVLNPAMLNIGT